MAESNAQPIQEKPAVVRRVYNVQYRQPGRKDGSKTPNRSGENMKQYNKNTDDDIFQLGNAFQSEDFDIDDFLNKFSSQPGSTVKQVVGDDGKTTTITTVRKVKPDDSGDVPMVDIDGDGIPDVPAVRKKRIITITRGDGTTQKIETSGDDDLDLEKLGVIQPGDSVHHEDEPSDTHHLLPPGAEDEPSPPEPAPETSDDTPAEANRGRERWNLVKTKMIKNNDDDDGFDLGDTILALNNRFHSRPGKRAYRMSHDEDMSSDEEEIQARWHSGLCPGQKRRTKRHMTIKEQKPSKTVGMAAAEIPGESELPAYQMLIINYSRMLDERPEEFRDTLFRAVKLNGLDVVKLLCRLVKRKNIELGSDEMREP